MEVLSERYKIIRKIGSGGMADVYLAHDEVLDREVAVKILRDELSQDPIHLLRFQREANAASEMVHPNIAAIYDVGHDHNNHYIVMEYVKGQTLKQLITARGFLEIDEALVFLKQIVLGLIHAHNHQIIHRDIKSQNILIKDDGTAKIVDFGIARALDTTQLTQTDLVLGSVHYMAPETARGESASIQSDIYALGIMLFEMLVGYCPFQADTPVQVALKHMQEKVPSLRQLKPNIPQSIENIVIKATAKNKIFRYNNGEQLYDDLLHALDRDNLNVKPLVLQDDAATIVMDKIPSGHNPTSARKWVKPLLTLGLGLVLFFMIWNVAQLFNKPPLNLSVTVPDLSEMSLEQARETLKELELNVAGHIRFELSDTVEKGKIIYFSPGFNQEVEKGTSISLVVSEGIYFTVPNFENKSLEQAKEALSSTKVVVRVEYETSETIKPGYVIRQEILAPNSRINPELSQEIKLIVARLEEINLPNLVGENINEAIATLKQLKVKYEAIKLDTEGLPEESYVPNIVVEMTPEGGMYVQDEESVVILKYY